MILGSGIGPVSYFPTKLLTWLSLALSSVISVRDEASLATASAISGRPGIDRGFDLAALESLRPYCSEPRPKDLLRLGVSVCDLDLYLANDTGRKYWRSLANAISLFAQEKPLEVVFLSLFCRSRKNDDDIAREMATDLRNVSSVTFETYQSSLRDIIAPLSSCDAVIATKYHAAVASYLTGRPLIVVAYNRKVRDFAQEIHLDTSRIQTIDHVPDEAEWLQLLRLSYDLSSSSVLPLEQATHLARTGISNAIEAITSMGEPKRGHSA
jgi:polysaccharide pyruvyl transferase WcaK-like protein